MTKGMASGGLRGSPGAIAYSATKWALRGMTKAAAIDINAGVVDQPMQATQ